MMIKYSLVVLYTVVGLLTLCSAETDENFDFQRFLKGPRICDSDDASKTKFCMSAEKRGNDMVAIKLAGVLKEKGWMAFGPGTSMRDADMTVVWMNDDEPICSDRESTGRIDPDVKEIQTCKVLANESSVNSDGHVYITFLRPIKHNDPDFKPLLNKKQSFIWAYSEEKPEDEYKYDSDIPRHNAESRGIFKINLLADNGEKGTRRPAVDMVFVMHGAAMLAAWLFFGPLGIFIARYMKKALGVWWFRLHLAFLILGTGGCTIFGVVMAFLHTEKHLNGVHQWMGVSVLAGMIIQMVLGQYANATFDPNRKEVPMRDKIHWWFGRLLVVGAIATCVFGILEKRTGNVLYWIYALAGSAVGFVLLFLLSEFFIGKSKEPQNDMKADDHPWKKNSEDGNAFNNNVIKSNDLVDHQEDSKTGTKVPDPKFFESLYDSSRHTPGAEPSYYDQESFFGGKSEYGPSEYGPSEYEPSHYNTGQDDNRHSQRNYYESEYGPSEYGQSEYGQSEYGKSEYGRSEYGQSEYGRSEYEPNEHARNEYRQSEFGQSEFGQSEYGRSEYGQSEYGPSVYGPSEYGPSEYDPSSYVEGKRYIPEYGGMDYDDRSEYGPRSEFGDQSYAEKSFHHGGQAAR